MNEQQLNWMRKEYRWQVQLSPTPFPLPKALKPVRVWLRLCNDLSDGKEMVPDTSNKTSYWFFRNESDVSVFMSYVRRYAKGIELEKRFCANLI